MFSNLSKASSSMLSNQPKLSSSEGMTPANIIMPVQTNKGERSHSVPTATDIHVPKSHPINIPTKNNIKNNSKGVSTFFSSENNIDIKNKSKSKADKADKVDTADDDDDEIIIYPNSIPPTFKLGANQYLALHHLNQRKIATSNAIVEEPGSGSETDDELEAKSTNVAPKMSSSVNSYKY